MSREGEQTESDAKRFEARVGKKTRTSENGGKCGLGRELRKTDIDIEGWERG